MTDELAVLPDVPLAPEAERALDRERATVLAGQVGTFRLTPEQQAALLVPATVDIVEVRPTGELYVPGKFYRDVLQRVFGPGAWAVRHGTPLMDLQEKDYQSTLYLNVFLMAGRCERCARSINACLCGGPCVQTCVAMAVGAQQYHPRNARLSYDDALEAAITNGLMRCCSKQLGAYTECWEPRWAEAVRNQIAVKVRVVDWNNKVVQRWRRHDRAPLDGEQQAPPKVVVTTGTSTPVHADDVSKPHGPAMSVVPGLGETIGQIRALGERWWLVTTDKGEHLTDDETFVRQLEGYKAQGKRVTFDDEMIETKRGPRRKIIEFWVV